MDRTALLFAAAQQSGGQAPELFPDPTVATSGNYTPTGDATFANPGLSMTDLGSDAIVTLAGAADTAMNALTNSTAYVVRLTVANWVQGSVRVRLKTGAFVVFDVTGNGVWTKTVTTGTGTSNVLRSDTNLDPVDLKITGISVKGA